MSLVSSWLRSKRDAVRLEHARRSEPGRYGVGPSTSTLESTWLQPPEQEKTLSSWDVWSEDEALRQALEESRQVFETENNEPGDDVELARAISLSLRMPPQQAQNARQPDSDLLRALRISEQEVRPQRSSTSDSEREEISRAIANSLSDHTNSLSDHTLGNRGAVALPEPILPSRPVPAPPVPSRPPPLEPESRSSSYGLDPPAYGTAGEHRPLLSPLSQSTFASSSERGNVIGLDAITDADYVASPQSTLSYGTEVDAVATLEEGYSDGSLSTETDSEAGTISSYDGAMSRITEVSEPAESVYRARIPTPLDFDAADSLAPTNGHPSTVTLDDCSHEAAKSSPTYVLPDEPPSLSRTVTPAHSVAAVSELDDENDQPAFAAAVRIGFPSKSGELMEGRASNLPEVIELTNLTSMDGSGQTPSSYAVEAASWAILLRFLLWHGNIRIEAAARDQSAERKPAAEAELGAEFRPQRGNERACVRLTIRLLRADEYEQSAKRAVSLLRAPAKTAQNPLFIRLPDYIALPSTLSELCIALYTMRHLSSIACSTQPSRNSTDSYRALRALGTAIETLAQQAGESPVDLQSDRNLMSRLRNRLRGGRHDVESEPTSSKTPSLARVVAPFRVQVPA